MSIIYPQSQSDSHEHLKERAFANMAEAARKVEHQAAEIQKLNEALAKQKQKTYKGQAAYSRLWFRANAALQLLRGEVAHLATEPTAEAELAAALKQHAAANDPGYDRALIERQAEAIRQLTDERECFRNALLDVGVPPDMLDPAVLAAYSASLRVVGAQVTRVMIGVEPKEVQRTAPRLAPATTNGWPKSDPANKEGPNA